MVLTEVDLDEIGDKIRDTMTEVLQQFKKKYMQMLGSIQKDLCKMQIQVNRLQVGVSQASAEQASLALRKIQVAELVRTLNLRNISLPEGSIHMEPTTNHIILGIVKNIGLKIAVLPNEILHALHAGVTEELRYQEKHTLNLISEYRVNNG